MIKWGVNVYLIGGRINTGELTTHCEQFDVNDYNSTHFSDLVIARHSAGVIMSNGSMLVFCGFWT